LPTICRAERIAATTETLLNRINLPLDWPAQLKALNVN
jgi:hypothetical protein